MSPRRTFRHPTAKRKNAETRAKVPTWCERTAAPMLKDERDYDKHAVSPIVMESE